MAIDPAPIQDKMDNGSGFFYQTWILWFNKIRDKIISIDSTIVAITSESTYTITDEYTLSCTAVCTVTLPLKPEVGEIHNVRNNISPSGLITLDGNGKNIDGFTTACVIFRYDSIKVQYDGTEWEVI